MASPLRSLTLSFTVLAAACGDSGGPASPNPAEPAPAAAVPSALVAPAIGLSTHHLYYCYTPAGTDPCVALKRQLRVSGTGGTALKWTAASQNAWIVVSPSSGTTPTSVTVSVDPQKLPAGRPVTGSVSIAAAGASNSPQRVWVVVNATGLAPLPAPAPALAFSDSAIGFCFMPSSSRACVRLAEQVRFSSTGAALAWRAVSNQPWIVVTPASGTTPTDVRVYADLNKVTVRGGTSVTGSITVSAAGAANSPQTIPVKLQFYSQPLPQ